MSQQTYLVVGASRGIGQAIARALLARGEHVIATCRQPQWSHGIHELQQQGAKVVALDIADDGSIAHVLSSIKVHTEQLDCVINCAGLLHDKAMQPEKQLRDLDRQWMLRAMNTNALGHVLLIQALEPLLTKAAMVRCISISARVGSIEDNQLGGWYAYRASKAALNMLMKNLSIEFARKYKERALVMVLHPGTTDTDLSRPFQQGMKYTLHSAEQTAANLLDILDQAGHEKNGAYLDHQAVPVPW